MKQGFLSQYFEGIAAKRLSAVEADLDTSNQHELNGVTEIKKIFGEKRNKLPATFVYLDDSEDEINERNVFLTWYDARESHPTRSEHRLYFPGNTVTEEFQVEDLVIIGKRSDGSVMLIAAKNGSSAERQLIWLFGLSDAIGGKFEVKDIEQNDKQLSFASKIIIEELGIEIEEEEEGLLELILDKFGGTFPKTSVFSEFARQRFGEVDIVGNPDETLISWMNHEEKLFRTLEKHIVAGKLVEGFGKRNNNVDEFINFSLSVQNRRKSRVGHAFENHLEQIFINLNIDYSRGKTTEGKKKPDFVFPSIDKYHDSSFPQDRLTMLGVKSTCKDRWRQVLSEAEKIENKHLLTLQPSITEDQTAEMRTSNLQLVVPKGVHETYTATQQKWLMNLREFIELVKERQ